MLATLEYDLDMDDFLAFNAHFNETSPVIRRQRLTQRLIGVGVAVAVGVSLGIASGSPVEGAVVAALSGVALWVLFPRLWARDVRRSLSRMAAGPGLGIVGPHSLSLDDSGIHETTPEGTSSSAWSGIRRVEETPQHAFIFFGPTQAYVIPKRIGELQAQAFLAEVREHCAR